MGNALIVFAKYPSPGHVKTRLTPVLTPGEAAQLYRAFLLDALEQYVALPTDVRLYLGEKGNEASLADVPAGVKRFEQSGATLGERMQRAFAETFAANYEHVVIIGTDHPTLPSAFVEQAFAALEAPASLCLGPSNDGGYYLLGMNAFYPQLFEEMQYSHERVFQETLARAERTDATLTVLPPWYDVDNPHDLQRLVDDLRAHPDQAPRTRALIEALGFPAVETT